MPGDKILPGLILDTRKEGLAAFFPTKWHEQLLEEYIFKHRGYRSYEVWKYCKDKDIRTIKTGARGTVSRASIINFLNSLVDMGVLGYNEKTGKGGYHKVYHPNMTLEQFKENAAYSIMIKLKLLFPDQDLIAQYITA